MIYRFGECRVDAEARQLVVRGRVAALPPKAFALLCVLIEERPRVVPKPELLELVWPDSFVSESNLAVLIKDIRIAIGDPAAPGSTARGPERGAPRRGASRRDRPGQSGGRPRRNL